MNLALVISSLNPREGGPVHFVRSFSKELTARGHQVRILTSDEPGAPAPYSDGLAEGVETLPLGPAQGGRYRYNPRIADHLRQEAARLDGVFVHGVWQHHSLAVSQGLRGAAVPYYLFFHGMLDPWFRRQYPLKHLKKMLYWRLFEERVVREARAVLCTSDEEKRLAPLSFRPYRANARVVDYGIEPPSLDGGEAGRFFEKHPALRDPPFVLYMGRVHEKKGLDLSLRAFEKTMPADWHFAIAGPVDNDWARSLRESTERSPLSPRIHWLGMLEGRDKWEALSAAKALVLQSHQENFGIVVVEALACGTPVILSKSVNIWRELDEAGVALCEEDTPEGCETAFRKWLKLTPVEQARMSPLAKETFHKRFTIRHTVDSILRIIQETDV